MFPIIPPLPPSWHVQKWDLITVVQGKKSRSKFRELVNKLMFGDVDVDARGEHGNTALHHAVLVSYVAT